MRRVLVILALVAGVTVLVVGSAAGGDEESYKIRAIFDNASFLVPGEDVRVAGANVGSVTELDVTRADEAVTQTGAPSPGKAVVVMAINDPAFQDFREDASCLIRPQSLIGEKYVECQPTQPRSAESEPPPELAEVPEGEPGEGQRLLPLENNGKAVDLDLVNNIMDEPYPERFRLILNDLGAGVAARGEELAEIVERSNPALRETNRVLAILGRQNRTLAQLSSDSDVIFSALARERESVASFINEAVVAGGATAERRADLEESFARFPGFLRELRATMTELDAFNDAATPTFADLRQAAPALTRVNELLAPFSKQGTRALTTLGDASEESGPPLVGSDPLLRDIRALARDGAPAARSLGQFFTTFRKTNGFQHLLHTIYGLGGTVNAFDEFGHFLRAVVPLNVCFDYYTFAQSGCGTNFTQALSAQQNRAQIMKLLRGLGADNAKGGKRGGGERGSEEAGPAADAGELEIEPPELDSEGEVESGPGEPEPVEPEPETTPDAGSLEAPGAATSARTSMRAMRDLLKFMVGPPKTRRAVR
jgi:phospholipid/cholesterol/gamma-HCH transport system substrate-binding protein